MRIALVFLGILLVAPAPVDAKPTGAEKCAAAKILAAGKLCAAKAKCRAKAALTSAAVDPACLQKAEEKFAKAIAKAELKGGCGTLGNAPLMDDIIDQCVADAAATNVTESCFSVGCPIGFVCTAEGVCVADAPPTGCSVDADCAAGSYCESGTCEDTSICASDEQCPSGQICDEARSTCIPGAPPPPACSTLTNQASCEARADCRAIIGGTNCQRPDGSTCQAGDANCVCQPPFVFQACVAR